MDWSVIGVNRVVIGYLSLVAYGSSLTGPRHPKTAPYRSIFPTLTSTGNDAKCWPKLVRFSFSSKAPICRKVLMADLIESCSGGSRALPRKPAMPPDIRWS